MREIPFDPNDPQAALRPAAPPQQAFDPAAHHAQNWHSVAPPGFVPPPATPANGGARPAPMTAQDEAAAFLAMPTNSAASRQTTLVDALMSTSTSRSMSLQGWLALDFFESIFGFFGIAVGLFASIFIRMFGGSGWQPRQRPRRTPRIR